MYQCILGDFEHLADTTAMSGAETQFSQNCHSTPNAMQGTGRANIRAQEMQFSRSRHT